MRRQRTEIKFSASHECGKPLLLQPSPSSPNWASHGKLTWEIPLACQCLLNMAQHWMKPSTNLGRAKYPGSMLSGSSTSGIIGRI